MRIWSQYSPRKVKISKHLCGDLRSSIGAARMAVDIHKAGSEAVIKVTNQGPPIEEVEQATIFKMFERTRQTTQSSANGWGIGLTIVKGLAEAHGGSVSVHSSRVAGTTFTVVLPGLL